MVNSVAVAVVEELLPAAVVVFVLGSLERIQVHRGPSKIHKNMSKL